MAEEHKNPYDYLRIHEFMKGLMESRALYTAFELGIIDFLIQEGHAEADEVKKISNGRGNGFDLLMDLLTVNNVIEKNQEKISLTEDFKSILPFRDIMNAILRFACMVTPDFTDLFTALVAEPEKFYKNSRIVNLFGYNLCYDYTPANYERAQNWINITTALTKYEAQVCMSAHDFSGYRRIIDIGGNSGEFALQICRKNPNISATVFDLPLVCDIGKKHVDQQPERDRITFIKGNAFSDDLPKGADLVIFKSMLHDWPDEAALHLLTHAAASLESGGRIMIFERSSYRLKDKVPTYSILPFLLFSQSFRSRTLYRRHLEKSGFSVNTMEVNLEMPFLLLTATKKANF